MQLVVLATDAQWEELTGGSAAVQWIRAAENFSFSDFPEAAAFFILQPPAPLHFAATPAPVFLNSVTATLQELHAPENVLRINGWNSFLKRPLWEIAGNSAETVQAVLNSIDKTAVMVNDEPGFIAGKIVAMIINEAYFALGDDVSGKAAIDTAMKLGTNYPYGPFEWAEKIGLKNIYSLLQKLCAADKRYTPAPALIKEAAVTNG